MYVVTPSRDAKQHHFLCHRCFAVQHCCCTDLPNRFFLEGGARDNGDSCLVSRIRWVENFPEFFPRHCVSCVRHCSAETYPISVLTSDNVAFDVKRAIKFVWCLLISLCFYNLTFETECATFSQPFNEIEFESKMFDGMDFLKMKINTRHFFVEKMMTTIFSDAQVSQNLFSKFLLHYFFRKNEIELKEKIINKLCLFQSRVPYFIWLPF